nr:MAG TPA: hypothetical protein [Caudoviricetes sp.]
MSPISSSPKHSIIIVMYMQSPFNPAVYLGRGFGVCFEVLHQAVSDCTEYEQPDERAQTLRLIASVSATQSQNPFHIEVSFQFMYLLKLWGGYYLPRDRQSHGIMKRGKKKTPLLAFA